MRLFIMAVLEKPGASEQEVQADVSRCERGPSERQSEGDDWAYVVLSPEAGSGVARLKRWLCGMRPAAKAWEEDNAENLRALGYVRGQTASTVFREPVGDVSLVVRGDEFTALGPIEELNKLEANMKEWYEVKTRGKLGPRRATARKSRSLT